MSLKIKFQIQHVTVSVIILTLIFIFISTIFPFFSFLCVFISPSFFYLHKNVDIYCTYAFLLLYKDKLKVQQESATCPFCTNMLHFYPAFFSRKSK